MRKCFQRSVLTTAGAVVGISVLDWKNLPRPGTHCWSIPWRGKREPEGGLLSLGLNPSQQTVVRLRSLDLGQVNRAEAAAPGVGGKGQNAAKAAATLLGDASSAKPTSVSVAQFLGGDSGSIIEKHLTSLGISQITQKVQAPTRQTMTLLDYPADKPRPEVTELVMPSAQLGQTEVDSLLAKVTSMLPKQKGILLMGSWPNGVDASFYSAVAQAKAEGATVLMDAFKPIDDVTEILLLGCVDCYKVNAFEICTLMGATGVKEGQISTEQVVDAIQRAFEKFPGVQSFAITDGPGRAYFFGREGKALQFTVPKVECLNPIGAGDTVAGVMMAAYCAGLTSTMHEAMHLGLAAASAKVQSESEGGIFDVPEMYRLKELITVQTVAR